MNKEMPESHCIYKESNFYEGEKDGQINQMVESFSYINCNFPSTHIAPV